jgi:hypothetical protein
VPTLPDGAGGDSPARGRAPVGAGAAPRAPARAQARGSPCPLSGLRTRGRGELPRRGPQSDRVRHFFHRSPPPSGLGLSRPRYSFLAMDAFAAPHRSLASACHPRVRALRQTLTHSVLSPSPIRCPPLGIPSAYASRRNPLVLHVLLLSTLIAPCRDSMSPLGGYQSYSECRAM